ncbi:hypothetical protein [Marinobacter sp. M3C]|uniref:hypothetical protein n=1 Tax=Marinobacter sp. M3C TaxID=2917715 RepID=UPI002010857F|nr:hypothetical protein [Marinobacter sp. M3C]
MNFSLVWRSGFITLQIHRGHRAAGELMLMRVGWSSEMRLEFFGFFGELDVSIFFNHDVRGANRRLQQFKEQ